MIVLSMKYTPCEHKFAGQRHGGNLPPTEVKAQEGSEYQSDATLELLEKIAETALPRADVPPALCSKIFLSTLHNSSTLD